MLKSISAHFGHCGPKLGRTLKNTLNTPNSLGNGILNALTEMYVIFEML